MEPTVEKTKKRFANTMYELEVKRMKRGVRLYTCQ
jgi:hypothetical protein